MKAIVALVSRMNRVALVALVVLVLGALVVGGTTLILSEQTSTVTPDAASTTEKQTLPSPTAIGEVGSVTPLTTPGTVTADASATPDGSPTAEGTVSPTAEGTPGLPTSTPDAATAPNFNPNGGGGNNVVKANNSTNGRLLVKGNLEMNRIPAPKVGPVNFAEARSTCTDCQTFATALQVNLYERGASQVTPQNAAVALNINCTRCITVARAIQYVIPVDDLKQTPKEVDDLFKALDRELRDINQSATTAQEANQRINGVIAQFKGLAQYLRDASQETTAGGTPTPSATATATIASTVAATAVSTGTASTGSTPGTAAPTNTQAVVAAPATATAAPSGQTPQAPTPTQPPQPSPTTGSAAPTNTPGSQGRFPVRSRPTWNSRRIASWFVVTE